MKALHFSIRYLSKARGSNLTRIISLTLGLSVSLLIFSYIGFLLSFDRCFPDHNRIYQVFTTSGISGLSSYMNAPLAPAMQSEIPCIESATRTICIYRDDFYIENQSFKGVIWPADTSFMDVFGLELVAGNNPREVFNTKDHLMLSESLAKAMFKDDDPIGKTVMYKNRLPFVVGGVFKDMPINTSFGSFNALMPFDFFAQNILYTGWDGGDSFLTYFKLKKDSKIEDVEILMDAFLNKYELSDFMEEWDMSIIFEPISHSSFMKGNKLNMIKLLSALALLMLFVATMNYVLISISGLVQRSRAIGLLKCNGAHKSNIFNIFLSETALLILAALALSVLIILGFSKQIESLTSYPITELFALERIWTPLSVLLAVFLLAGIIPGRLFTSVPVQSAFQGVTDRHRRWKRILLGVEIACISTVICLLVVSSLQFKNLNDGDFGYEHNNLVYTMLIGRPSDFQYYVDELEAMPEVEAAGNANSLPAYGYPGQPCVDEITNEILFSCRMEFCDKNYIPAMGMKILEGTNFDDNTKPLEVIVNEKYVKMRGWTENVIGHIIKDAQGSNAPYYTIIGVVKDFRMDVMSGEIKPIVIHKLFADADKDGYYGGMRTMIRLKEMNQKSQDAVMEQIKKHQSASGVSFLDFYDDIINKKLLPVRSFRNITLIVAIVTLLISIIGLLGYLNDEVNRRSREIAIRKINGAEVFDVLALFVKNTWLLVLPSIIIGLTIAWFTANKMLQMFESRIFLSWWIFAGCGFVVAAIVYLVQILKTWKIANDNPSNMIKSE